MHWLAGWLAGRLAGWQAGKLAGRLAGWQTGRLAGWLAGWLKLFSQEGRDHADGIRN